MTPKEKLEQLRAVFTENGGRGVEMAEQIDRLQDYVDARDMISNSDYVKNEGDFVEIFSPFINKEKDGTYSFEESPMGLWVSFPKEEWITISGWEGPKASNPIREKTFGLPLPVSSLIKLLYAREDASRIICREERDPINDHPEVIWAVDQVVWRKQWDYLGCLDMRLEGEDLIAFFEKNYKKQEKV